MKLSILICHLESRVGELKRLLDGLLPQCEGKPVEVRIDADDGSMTVGMKRNKLLAQAIGEYVAFVDDDDEVDAAYVDEILAAIESLPDSVGIEGVLKGKENDYIFSHSIEYAGWYSDGRVYYRTPNHLNPVKRAIALKVGFELKNFGEDRIYSDRIRPLLKTEVYVPKILYTYHCEDKPVEVKKP